MTVEPTPAPQAAAWLDEQRRQDKEIIGKVQQQLDRTTSQLRDTLTRLDRLDEDVRQTQAYKTRLALAEDGLRQMREIFAQLQERGQQVERNVERASLLRQTDQEKDRKAIADLQAQVAELNRREEESRNRLVSLSSDMKLKEGSVVPLQQRLEHIAKQLETVPARFLPLEEQRKRVEMQLEELRRAQDANQTHQVRLNEWQQGLDLRVNREFAEWQQRMDNWSRIIEDQTRNYQLLTQQVQQTRNEWPPINERLVDLSNRQNEMLSEIQRVAHQREIDREEAVRTRSLIDAMQVRLKEQSDALQKLEEDLARTANNALALVAFIEEANKKREELAARLARIEEQVPSMGEFQEALAYELRAWRLEWENFTAVQADVSERQKRRLIAELEQQVREVKEQFAGKDKEQEQA